MRRRMGGIVCAAALALGIMDRALCQQTNGGRPPIEIQQKLPESPTPGQPVLIEIHIRNRSEQRVENVIAAVTLTEGWQALDAEPSSERTPGAMRWPLGVIEVGMERVLHLRVATKADGRSPHQLRSTVNVTFQSGVQNTATAVVAQPALTMQISAPVSAQVGETAYLKIMVNNAGTAAAEGIVLQTVLPAGLSHPGGNDLETEVGTLQPGESRRIALAVTPTRVGEFRHRVRLLIKGRLAAEEESVLSTQDLKITVTPNGPRLLYTESAGNFEVTLRNDDTQQLEQVGVAINLPPGLGVLIISDDGLYESRDHSLRWNLPVLKPGETRTLAWSGVARKVGDQECTIHVSNNSGGQKSATWRTGVTAGAERPSERLYVPRLPQSDLGKAPVTSRAAVVDVQRRPAQDSSSSLSAASEGPHSRPPPPTAVGWDGRFAK
jgi:uncharacterized repeat protein (TIGR01451 family)